MHRYSAKLVLGAHAAAGVSASAGVRRPGGSLRGASGFVKTVEEAGRTGSGAATAGGAQIANGEHGHTATFQRFSSRRAKRASGRDIRR